MDGLAVLAFESCIERLPLMLHDLQVHLVLINLAVLLLDLLLQCQRLKGSLPGDVFHLVVDSPHLSVVICLQLFIGNSLVAAHQLLHLAS